MVAGAGGGSTWWIRQLMVVNKVVDFRWWSNRSRYNWFRYGGQVSVQGGNGGGGGSQQGGQGELVTIVRMVVYYLVVDYYGEMVHRWWFRILRWRWWIKQCGGGIRWWRRIILLWSIPTDNGWCDILEEDWYRNGVVKAEEQVV